jgi:hypothetical protein
MPGGELVRAVFQIGWGEAGESFECPDEMRLIVIKLVDMIF